MRYRRKQLTLGLALFAYLVFALVVGFFGKHREVFPLFTWSLFSRIPEQRVDFAVLVTEWQGQAFQPPRDFVVSKDLFPGAGQVRAYYVVQSFGAALYKRKVEESARLRALLEREYLAPQGESLRYLVVLRVFDPVDRWRSGKFGYRPIAEFALVGSP